MIPKKQYFLVIRDTFKGQDTDIVNQLCNENFCEVFIVPPNLTNKYQPLDISVNKPTITFISGKYDSWFSKQASAQLALQIEDSKIKVSAKLFDIKLLHAQWLVDFSNHMCEEKETIINGFKSAGLAEAIQSAQEQ